MDVSDDDVRHVAALARLAIPAEAIPQFAGELRGILAHMRQLREFAGQTVEGDGAGGGTMPRRPDEPRAGDRHMAIATFAPDARDGFFVVPQVVAHAPAAGAPGGAGAEPGGMRPGEDDPA